ncbi:MAG TPA: GTPase Era [Verrucomicrobiae bacterium]|nr:GTPase Era [Verrucomicrobiae bacterium]
MRSGMVAVVGRPNVGKSSLVNAMVGQKVSIVTRKPQTTRHRIQGVIHRPGAQVVLVDTPGLHMQSGGRALNRYLNDTAASTLDDSIDLVLFVVEAGKWNEEDDAVLSRLVRVKAPVALVINKVDKVADKSRLLPEIQQQATRREWAFILPVSALKRDNLLALADQLVARMPQGPALYDEGQVDAQDLSFTLAEIVREKLMERLRQELPYVLTVQIEKLEREAKLTRIEAVVWVERENQKAIVIGEKGQALKAVGVAARREMEKRLGQQVFLKIWARASKNWTDDPDALKRFGYQSR